MIETKNAIEKPLLKAINFASQISHGASTQMFQNRKKDTFIRSRIPRIFYGPEKIFQTYSVEDSLAMEILRQIDKKYENYTIIKSKFLNISNNLQPNIAVLIILVTHLIMINIHDYSIIWKIKADNIKKMIWDVNEITFLTKKQTKYIKVIFNDS